KGENTEEVAGFVESMLEAASPLTLDEPESVIDIVGTGGSRALAGRAFNVSTMASIVAAGAGARVCKHGNRKASSTSGSTDLLEALGVAIELDGSGVAACVREAGIGFAFARIFHPSMRFAGPVRSELGIPTIFNLLGPMSHPGRVGRQLLGVADPGSMDLIAGVLHRRGVAHAWIVNGEDGLDELTTAGRSQVIEVKDGELRRFDLSSTDLGLAPATLDEIGVGDPLDNARVAESVLAGDSGPLRDMVVLNAGAALLIAGVASDLESGVRTAESAIDNGSAARVLGRLVAVSRAAAGIDEADG
ncbi:MAG TPA: anthranilate phosphoribosyltransferase, partial [Microthrixaceae bacterium]|nr:anthranilate phosphoribosyltransferase [Microthrixaceae bacterium]